MSDDESTSKLPTGVRAVFVAVMGALMLAVVVGAFVVATLIPLGTCYALEAWAPEVLITYEWWAIPAAVVAGSLGASVLRRIILGVRYLAVGPERSARSDSGTYAAAAVVSAVFCYAASFELFTEVIDVAWPVPLVLGAVEGILEHLVGKLEHRSGKTSDNDA